MSPAPRSTHVRWYNWYANALLARDVGQLAATLSGGLVVDVGCGEEPYRDSFHAFARYIGIDSPGRPDTGSSADVYADAEELPIVAECADAVLCTEVIEHVPEPSRMLAEIRRVLKPGGALVLTSPFTWHVHDEPHDYWRFTEHGLRHVLGRAGFHVIALRAVNGSLGAMLQSQCYVLVLGLGRLRVLARPVVWLMQALASLLRPIDKNHRFTSNYVVLARKA